ncbi:uncharacterized protein LOC113856340 [Abrus precatorius]|uniref:Uncharacterized protein LOC113856340 n=1 Tax=Abrus precatorius TaxID=3816 RepID=A0A8B8KJB4_ABRPR|nr:uncharacterized protein LOC113856340 [Abrus precatorius]
MVVSLGPGKFYGTSLPRPRIYADVKFNDHRVDPPVSVTDPLMSWAQEAHWSMGGLSFKRLRLQGKIEGNVDRLRSQREKLSKTQAQSPLPPAHSDLRGSKRTASPSPPPAPVATKRRRRLMALIEQDEEKEEEQVKVVSGGVRRRRLVKKLGDDFDRVASLENEVSDTTSLRARSPKSVQDGEAAKVVEEAVKSNPKGNKSEAEKSPVSVNGVRTSPRFAKRRSN